MAEPRVTYPIDPALNRDCDLMHLESYELREVFLPGREDEPPRRAIAIVIRGRNLRAMAQPLTAFVGEQPVQYLRIAPDERSVEGVLLEEPEQGAPVRVWLGDLDAAEHPIPVDRRAIDRIG